LSSAVLVAEDHCVLFDEDVNFSAFKTFTVHVGSMTSDRPELNFPVLVKTLGDAVRGSLSASGLKEAADRADLVVEYSVTGVDYNIGPFGRPSVVTPAPRGGRGSRSNAGPVDFTEATLVVDLSHGTPATLIWRGVYHDSEKDAGTLAATLPKGATKLLSQYPPRKK
jgi:hypothetical protein